MLVVDEPKLYSITINYEVQEAMKLLEVYTKTDKYLNNNSSREFLDRLRSKCSQISSTRIVNAKSSNNSYIEQEIFDIPEITLNQTYLKQKGLSLLNIINNNDANENNFIDSDVHSKTMLSGSDKGESNFYCKREKSKSKYIQEILDLLNEENETQINNELINFKSSNYMVYKVTKDLGFWGSEKVSKSKNPIRTNIQDITYHVAHHYMQTTPNLMYQSQIVDQKPNDCCHINVTDKPSSIQIIYDPVNEKRMVVNKVPGPNKPCSYVCLPLYENCPYCGEQHSYNNENYSYYYGNAAALNESVPSQKSYTINYEPTSYICPECGQQHLLDVHSLYSSKSRPSESNSSHLGHQDVCPTSLNLIDYKLTDNSSNSVCPVPITISIKSISTPVDSVCAHSQTNSFIDSEPVTIHLKSMPTSPINTILPKLRKTASVSSDLSKKLIGICSKSIPTSLICPKPSGNTSLDSVTSKSVKICLQPLATNPVVPVCSNLTTKACSHSEVTRSTKNCVKSMPTSPIEPICPNPPDETYSNLDFSKIYLKSIPKTPIELICPNPTGISPLDSVSTSRPVKVNLKSIPTTPKIPVCSNTVDTASLTLNSTRPAKVCLKSVSTSPIGPICPKNVNETKINLKSACTSPIELTCSKPTCITSLDSVSSKPVKNRVRSVSTSPIRSNCLNPIDKFSLNSSLTKQNNFLKPIPASPVESFCSNARENTSVASDLSKIYLKSTCTRPIDSTCPASSPIKMPVNPISTSPIKSICLNPADNVSSSDLSKPVKICRTSSPIKVVCSDSSIKLQQISSNSICEHESNDIPLYSDQSEPVMSISLNSICKRPAHDKHLISKSVKPDCSCSLNNKKTDTANLKSVCSKLVSANLNSEPSKKKQTCKCILRSKKKPAVTVSSKTTSVKSEDIPCCSSVCQKSDISVCSKPNKKRSESVKELLDKITSTYCIPSKKSNTETNKIVKFKCEKSLQTGSSFKMKDETNQVEQDHQCKECDMLKESIVSLIRAVFGIATKRNSSQQTNIQDVPNEDFKRSCSSCLCRQKKKKINNALEESYKLNGTIQRAKDKKYGDFKDTCHRIKGLDKILRDTLLEPYLEYLLDEEMCLHEKKKKSCNLCRNRRQSIESCDYFDNNSIIFSLIKHLKRDQVFDKDVTDYLKSLKTKSFCNEEFNIDL